MGSGPGSQNSGVCSDIGPVLLLSRRCRCCSVHADTVLLRKGATNFRSGTLINTHPASCADSSIEFLVNIWLTQKVLWHALHQGSFDLPCHRSAVCSQSSISPPATQQVLGQLRLCCPRGHR